MTSFGPTSNETASASKEATSPAPGDSTVHPAAGTAVPTDATLPSNPSVEAPAASKTSAPRKVPVRKPKAVATKTAAAKAPPMKAKPTKSVATKSSAQEAASSRKKTPPKAGVKAVAPKKAAPLKKSPSKKVAAKKAAPLKRKTANRVEAPAPVSKSVAPATVATRPLKVRAPEAVRDAGKGRAKLVRDSFTMPQQDFGLIAALKERALNFKRSTKKSELLRAGLQALQQLPDGKLRAALDSLVPLKAGRPKKRAD